MSTKPKIIQGGLDTQTSAGASALTVDGTTGAATIGPSGFDGSHNFRGYSIFRSAAAGAGQQAMYISKVNVSATNDIFISFHSNNNTGATIFDIRWNGSNGAFANGSDERIKKNIESIAPVLSRINQLRPVNFQWKESDSESISTGFIAQEMQRVFPEDVFTRDDGMLGVSGWNKTEAILVKAIQELSAQVEELKAEVALLKAK